MGPGQIGICCFIGIFHAVGLGLIIGGSYLVATGSQMTAAPALEGECTMDSSTSYYIRGHRSSRSSRSSSSSSSNDRDPEAHCVGTVSVYPSGYDLQNINATATCEFAGDEGCECNNFESCSHPLVCQNEICSIKPVEKILCYKIDTHEVYKWNEWNGDEIARDECPRYLPEPGVEFHCYFKSGLMDTCSNYANTITSMGNKAKPAVFRSVADMNASTSSSIIAGAIMIPFGICWWCCVCFFTASAVSGL